MAPPRNDQEHSEALLYRNSLLAEYDLPSALTHLHSIEDIVCAPGTIYEFEANYLTKLNDPRHHEELIEAWSRLVDRNPENREFLFGLEKAHNLAEEERKGFWEGLATTYPKSTAIKLIPLDFLQGILVPSGWLWKKIYTYV